MTNGEKLEQIFPDGICPFSQNWLKTEYKEPTTKNDLAVDWENYKDLDGNSLDDLILEVLQNNFDCGNTYGYKVADEIIGLLPSVTPQEPRWIPVSERLPEICEKDCHGDITFSKTVFSTQIYGDGYVNVNIDKYTTNNGGGWLSEVPFDNPDECCKVIAWMPLPKAYREVEE